MSNTAKLDQIKVLLPHFIDGVKNVFETMVFIPATGGELTPKNQGMPTGCISGTISLTGEVINGNLSLMFSLAMATTIFRSMMGMDKDAQVNQQEINDVVGELTNMVAGNAKSKLQAMDVHFKIGLPTVVVGEGHYIEPARNVETVVALFKVEDKPFYMELSC